MRFAATCQSSDGTDTSAEPWDTAAGYAVGGRGGDLHCTEEKGAREDETDGWRPQLNEHESEQAPRDSEGQGSLAFCSPWGRKDLGATEHRNSNMLIISVKPGKERRSCCVL